MRTSQVPCFLVGIEQWKRLADSLPLRVDGPKEMSIGLEFSVRGVPCFLDRSLAPDDAFLISEKGAIRLAGRRT